MRRYGEVRELLGQLVVLPPLELERWLWWLSEDLLLGLQSALDSASHSVKLALFALKKRESLEHSHSGKRGRTSRKSSAARSRRQSGASSSTPTKRSFARLVSRERTAGGSGSGVHSNDS